MHEEDAISRADLAVRVDSPTEARNQRTLAIDTVPTLAVLELLNDEDARVAAAVRDALPSLATAVDAAIASYEGGGTVHYFGAGTSGRIGSLDAVELPPTFSVDPSRVVAHHAGSEAAIDHAIEGVEDDQGLGEAAARDVKAGDIAIGLAASGRTPYVLGALLASKAAGAFTVLMSSAPRGSIADVVDVHVLLDTGPEAIAGSTRLKAGTAQKMALNSFSTALMVGLGKTYSNLMVDVARTNSKLRGRALAILEEASGASEESCAQALEAAAGDVRVALVSLLGDVDPIVAAAALDGAGGRIRDAIAALAPAEGGSGAPMK